MLSQSCCAVLCFSSLSLSLSLVQKHFSYVNNACRFSLVLWSLLCTMSPGPNSSAIALCLVLLHLLWVYPPHKLHLMVKEVEAHEVLVENDWGFWALLFVFENLFISTSILWSCWGGGGRGCKKRAAIRVMSGITGPQFCQIWRWNQKVRMKTGHKMETVLNFVFHVVDSYRVPLIMAKIASLLEDIRWIKLKLILLKWKEHVSKLVDAILPLTIIFSITQLPWLDVKKFGSWMVDENGVSWDNWKMDGSFKSWIWQNWTMDKLRKADKKWPRKFYK